MTTIEIILSLAALVLALPVAVLVGECALALLPAARRDQSRRNQRPRVAVLIAAHNEEADLAATLTSVSPQLREDDRLVVIADNCTDATADIARRHGAEVCERFDRRRRGKGYALDFGLCYVAHDPPEVVVMIDADCTVNPDALDELAHQVEATARPAQALYLMEHPSPARAKDLVSALAFLVKNRVRPSGLHRLGMPCLLTGSGMAFPWRLIRRAQLASGNIVEDMQLGLDLALAGNSPVYCGAAQVTGRLPSNSAAAKTQRTRWEHGHLRTLLREAPRLFSAGFRQRRAEVLSLALDLCVPPLSMLVIAWALVTAIATFGPAPERRSLPLLALLIEGGLMTLAIFAVWFKYGRRTLPLTSLLAAPLYLLWKIPLYLGFLLRPQSEWVRTGRGPASTAESKPVTSGVAAPLHAAGPAEQISPSDQTNDSGSLPAIDLRGLRLHAIKEDQCVSHICSALEKGMGGRVVTPNLDFMRRLSSDETFAALCRGADLIVADGMPLIWASRLQGTPLPQRVAGSDLILSLSREAGRRGRSIFLLGGAPGTDAKAAKELQARFPGLHIAGHCCPEIGTQPDAQTIFDLVDQIRRDKPDIVFVALGSPKQEQLIAALFPHLPRAWWIGVGVSFSFVCGDIRRAPRWMQRAGLEWVHRLIQEPRRLAGRYLLKGLPFAVTLLAGSLFTRLRHRQPASV